MCIFEDPTHNIFDGWTGPLGISATKKIIIICFPSLLTIGFEKTIHCFCHALQKCRTSWSIFFWGIVCRFSCYRCGCVEEKCLRATIFEESENLKLKIKLFNVHLLLNEQKVHFNYFYVIPMRIEYPKVTFFCVFVRMSYERRTRDFPKNVWLVYDFFIFQNCCCMFSTSYCMFY